jgi:hypothetical protein
MSGAVSATRTIVVDQSGTVFLQWPIAEPNENLDYSIDISAALAASSDGLTQVAVSAAPSGTGELTVQSVNVVLGVITAWLSGGVPGRTYQVRIDALTNQGRVFEMVVILPIDAQYAIPPIPLPPSSGFSNPVVWRYNVMELESGSGYWQLENASGAWLWG